MKRFENTAEKAIRVKNNALRCAETRPEPTQEVVNLCEGERAQAEAEEMMKPVGEIELQEARFGGVISLEISTRNGRLEALQKRWVRLRSALDELLDQRGVDMVEIPGGSTGLLYKDFKGKEAGRLVTRVDPGVLALAAELRAIERQAAEETGQWGLPEKESKVTIDATPAAIMLGMLMSKEQLQELKRKAIEFQQRQLEAGPG